MKTKPKQPETTCTRQLSCRCSTCTRWLLWRDTLRGWRLRRSGIDRDWLDDAPAQPKQTKLF